MIGFIRGILFTKQPPKLLIDINGLGYEVESSMTSIYQLPELNQQVSLYTHLVIREDAQLLYGFITASERDLFRKLIKINGVGPKLALALLSVEVNELAGYVQSNNSMALTRIPGVGKKTAERLVIELKDKVGDYAIPANSNFTNANDEQDAVSALVALGYKLPSATSTVHQIIKNDANLSCEEIIKQALRQIK